MLVRTWHLLILCSLGQGQGHKGFYVKMVSAHNLENYLSKSFYILNLTGLSEDMAPIDVVYTRSTVKVTRVTFVKTYIGSLC